MTMTAAPELKPNRHARTTAYTPRPLPVWLQVGMVVLLLVQGVQMLTHHHEPSLAVNAAPQERIAYFYQPDNLRASGNMQPSFQYAGYYAHAPGTVSVTPMHAYAPSTGRWVERDPLPAK